MERRIFIKNCGFTCFTVVGITAFLEGCGTNYFAQTNIHNNLITIKKTEFLKEVNNKTKERKYVLIKVEKVESTIILYKNSNTAYSALLMLCTHKGCELQPNGDFLVCPCHGSEFTNKGKVINPPADEDLRQFKTTVDNENIYIQL